MSRGARRKEAARTRPRGVLGAGVWLTVLLAAQAFGVYQLRFNTGGIPTFRRGGTFIAVGSPTQPVPYGDATGGAGDTTTTTVAVDPTPVTGISVPPREDRTAPSVGGSDGAPAPGALPGAPAALPAPGTYVYDVTGTESASGFGSRSYEPTMTMVVHQSPDLPADQTVVDATFSDKHQEREVLARTDAGLAFAFEGGSITFGPGTQTSQADYDPPMLQVPSSFAPGTSVAGTSAARSSDGSTSRVEDWTVSVVGQEQLTIGGVAVDTWVVDLHRQTRPGSSDQVTRDRRYWYDPSRALWVKWRERFRGRRSFIVDFTYESDYEATLQQLP